MKKYLRHIYTIFRIVIIKFFSSTRFTSSLYYFLISNSFSREHQAVLKGKLKYFKENRIKKNAYYLLRRNIHRIEKGLIMKNRRSVFAMDYIEDTVDAYVKIVKNDLYKNNLSEINLKWYTDVLSEYFEVIDLKNEKLQKLKVMFDEQKKNSDLDGKPSTPYARDFELLNIDFDSFLMLNKLRRSVRWYDDRPVPREILDKAMTVAKLSPSACNRQPFEFRIFDDKELIQEISNITWGTTGFSQNFPVFIVVIGNLEAYYEERDRHVIYIDASLASMTFMLALETLGLSSCPINWPDVGAFESKIRSILSIGINERPIMLMSCGYPDKKALVPYSEKKDLFEIRNYNKIN